MNNGYSIYRFLCFLLLGCALTGVAPVLAQSYSAIQSTGLFLLTLLLVVRWSYKSLNKVEVIVSVLIGIALYFLTQKVIFHLPLINLILCIMVFLSISMSEEESFEFWKKSFLIISLIQAFIVIPTLIPFFSALMRIR